MRIEGKETDMKTMEEYLALPYTIEMIQQSNASWFVGIKELPGCMSQGDTPEEAVAMIHDAMRAWIEVALEDGIPIPEPQVDEDYSGRFMVRVPRGLHRQLVHTADLQEVSLNAYCIAVLAQSLGQPVEGNQTFPGFADAIKRLLNGDGADIRGDLSLEENLSTWMNKEMKDIETLLQVEKTQEALYELFYLSKCLQKAGKKSPTFQFLGTLISFTQRVLSSQPYNQPLVDFHSTVEDKIFTSPDLQDKQRQNIELEKNKDDSAIGLFWSASTGKSKGQYGK